MPKPIVKLVGTNGNVFNLIGKTCAALKKAGMWDECKEFEESCYSAESYDAVLQLIMKYCEVK